MTPFEIILGAKYVSAYVRARIQNSVHDLSLAVCFAVLRRNHPLPDHPMSLALGPVADVLCRFYAYSVGSLYILASPTYFLVI